ncbi:uncharacterized protein T551_02198 [Pneumocystis jirovecii RU7]|uniref:CENP-C homolog n=1 Tax=Pneumocystis jirovecii (strain RU7) TaxID=1408657 RepID=A0A0W4ZMH7_PNEJ7|nr:uncharacterized protein T551_02198 [Pneumocystis jirovecii RU7]KTW29582.1 hypothetical protein T551_02198 [Pneumocystis jirovecii RU7]
MIWQSASMRQTGSATRPNGQFMEIGIVGRKTGLKINEDIQRDSFGMEDIDAFFSQVTPPLLNEMAVSAQEVFYKNDQTISLEQSMDVANSPSRDVSDVIASRKPLNAWPGSKLPDALTNQRIYKGESPWISRSPVKTNLKSPALRVPSTQKRECLISPRQLDWSDGVARRLDFSATAEVEDEPVETYKPVTQAHMSTKRGLLVQQKTRQKTFSLMNNSESSEADLQDNVENGGYENIQDWNESFKHDTEESIEKDFNDKMVSKPRKESPVKKRLTNTDGSRKKQKASRPLLKSKKVVSKYSPEKHSFSSHSSAESSDVSSKIITKTKMVKKHSKHSDSSEDSPPTALSPRVNATRRSLRTKVAPLAYWRNERIVYELGERRKSGPAMPKIKEIIRIDPISIPSRSKGTGRVKNTSFKKKMAKHESTSDEEWEEKVDVECEVINWHDKKPIIKRIAYPASSYAPRDVANAIIKFQKTFDEAPFFATGVMDLPRGGEKTTKPSKHNVMTFVILEGAVEATVHQTSFRLKRGSHFIVPRGNYYSIRNIANKVSRLFFTQATDTLENEELRV